MQIIVTGTGEKSLKTLLEEKGVSLYAPCAGRGTCGQCAVIVTSGDCPPSAADMERFSKEELDKGFRLACRAFPKGELTVQTPERENPVICTEFLDNNSQQIDSVSSETGKHDTDALVGIDLGTTTIVLRVLGRDGTLGDTRAFLNPLSAYGADVVSRLEAASEGHLKEMKAVLRCRIEEELKSLNVSQIALAGNTVMTHIFMGWDTSGLGEYPFKPYSLAVSQTELLGIPVTVFPGISAFVGGDIVAGIYGLDLINGHVGDMLMDLGTNGEMVLMTEKGMIASSASAGPALEGAHISCGTGCVEGAVTGITLENLRPILTVAGSKIPGNKGLAGACGSAVLELIDELLRTGIIKPDGSFIESYADEGFAFGTDRSGRVLALTQADVREIQLAKGAVSTAALMLCEKGEVPPDKLRVRLAGGMGTGLRPEKIRRTGLLPKGAEVRAVGNSVLCGLMRFLKEASDSVTRNYAIQALSDIAGSVTVYDLALDEGFQERFLTSLNFIL
ncbi:MAG: DUF4445 domain-containing protein [Lachnospiraceae bacterium]|nr:DUF4445 domain-containing protein [Lachnospiraceae bacterium]